MKFVGDLNKIEMLFSFRERCTLPPQKMASASNSRANRAVESMMCDLLRDCAELYGFDSADAISKLIKGKQEKVVKEKRGRPKKVAKEIECEKTVDLFAELVCEVNEEKFVGVVDEQDE